MTELYFDQLTLSGGKSSPCHPAYHVVATTSARLPELEDEDEEEPDEDPEPEDPLEAEEVEEAGEAEEPDDLEGRMEQVGAAQT